MKKEINALIISSNATSKVFNNGKTIESMFSCFSRNELSQLFFRPQNSKYIDFEFCKSYYCVSEMDIANRVLLRSEKCGGIVENDISDISEVATTYDKVSKKSMLKSGLVRDLVWSLNLWKNATLKKWCNSTNADVVFVVLGGAAFSYKISKFIANYLNIPLVLFITDDYILNPKYDRLIDEIQRKRMLKITQKAADFASIRFVIGEIMAKEYINYFGKEFNYIMNSVDIEPYVVKEKFASEKMVISYFGGLGLNRWMMITRFAKVLRDKVIVKVYSLNITEEITNAFKDAGVMFCGSVNENEIKEKMLESDALLHVESDDIGSRTYTKLAVSTKIPEYLMSGRLVLGYGPTEVASMRLLSDNGIGLVISSIESDDVVREKLERAILNSDYRNEMGKIAYDYAVKNFDKEKNAKEFRNKLRSIIK